MPDYDPKNIPTLDDIIEEDDGFNDTDPGSTDLKYTNRDLTGTITVDLNTGSNTDASRIETEERAEAEVTNLDLFLDETGERQSALPETYCDENDHDTNNRSTDTSPVSNIAASEKLQISLDPSELDSIVESIVNKLLPDLEQQLRILLRQTLRDKLSEEVNTLLESETGQDNNAAKADQ